MYLVWVIERSADGKQWISLQWCPKIIISLFELCCLAIPIDCIVPDHPILCEWRWAISLQIMRGWIFCSEWCASILTDDDRIRAYLTSMIDRKTSELNNLEKIKSYIHCRYYIARQCVFYLMGIPTLNVQNMRWKYLIELRKRLGNIDRFRAWSQRIVCSNRSSKCVEESSKLAGFLEDIYTRITRGERRRVSCKIQ